MGVFDSCCCCFASSTQGVAAVRSDAGASLDVRMRLDSVAQKEEPAPSTAPESIYTHAAVHSLPPAIEQVVALNMTQERRRPSMKHALSTYTYASAIASRKRAMVAPHATSSRGCHMPASTRLTRLRSDDH
jgi:hypothetical protein